MLSAPQKRAAERQPFSFKTMHPETVTQTVFASRAALTARTARTALTAFTIFTPWVALVSTSAMGALATLAFLTAFRVLIKDFFWIDIVNLPFCFCYYESGLLV
jgi:uncharacterized protein YqcC (DUF446 family)